MATYHSSGGLGRHFSADALSRAGSLHVLLGYNRGDYRWYRLVARYTVGQGFDGSKGGLQGSD